ncbi:MAG: isocitrate/isopropylmalate dehydrogenase family protein, partial [Thermoplasmata archaeon]
KYAGQYKVNPTAMILASKLMLEWLGEIKYAKQVETGVSTVIEEGKVKTYDMGGSSSTLEVANEVVKKMG